MLWAYNIFPTSCFSNNIIQMIADHTDEQKYIQNLRG